MQGAVILVSVMPSMKSFKPSMAMVPEEEDSTTNLLKGQVAEEADNLLFIFVQRLASEDCCL
jgi:hypothetical protein